MYGMYVTMHTYRGLLITNLLTTFIYIYILPYVHACNFILYDHPAFTMYRMYIFMSYADN
jgi:hypothetical protein